MPGWRIDRVRLAVPFAERQGSVILDGFKVIGPDDPDYRRWAEVIDGPSTTVSLPTRDVGHLEHSPTEAGKTWGSKHDIPHGGEFVKGGGRVGLLDRPSMERPSVDYDDDDVEAAVDRWVNISRFKDQEYANSRGEQTGFIVELRRSMLGEPPGDLEDDRGAFFAQVLLSAVAEKSRPADDWLHRGLHLTEDQFRQLFPEGEEVNLPISSWSTDPNTAWNFGAGIQRPGEVAVYLHAPPGAMAWDISNLSEYGEQESISGGVYRIQRIEAAKTEGDQLDRGPSYDVFVEQVAHSVRAAHVAGLPHWYGPNYRVKPQMLDAFGEYDALGNKRSGVTVSLPTRAGDSGHLEHSPTEAGKTWGSRPGVPHGGEFTSGGGHLFSTAAGGAHKLPPKLLEELTRIVGQPGEGASINARTGESASKGYMVAEQGKSYMAYPADLVGRPDLVAQLLFAFLMANRRSFEDHSKYVGMWYDPDNDEIVLDPSDNLPGGSDQASKAAKLIGKARNQQAIYDVEKDDVIDTGGTGDRDKATYWLPPAAQDRKDHRHHVRRGAVGLVLPGGGPPLPGDRSARPAKGRGAPEGGVSVSLPTRAIGHLPASPSEAGKTWGSKPGVPHGGEFTSIPTGELTVSSRARPHPNLPGLTFDEAAERLRGLIAASKEGGHFEHDRLWYVRNAVLIEAEAHRLGIEPWRFAGVVAATSVRTQWDRKDGHMTNLVIAARAVELARAVGTPKQIVDALRDNDQLEGAIGRNLVWGMRIARGEPIVEVLGGPKVRSFYNNFVFPNETDDVTIDTWMAKAIAGRAKLEKGEDKKILGVSKLDRLKSGELSAAAKQTIAAYGWCADLIRYVARLEGLSPAEAQAVVWCQYRFGKTRAKEKLLANRGPIANFGQRPLPVDESEGGYEGEPFSDKELEAALAAIDAYLAHRGVTVSLPKRSLGHLEHSPTPAGKTWGSRPGVPHGGEFVKGGQRPHRVPEAVPRVGSPMGAHMRPLIKTHRGYAVELKDGQQVEMRAQNTSLPSAEQARSLLDALADVYESQMGDGVRSIFDTPPGLLVVSDTDARQEADIWDPALRMIAYVNPDDVLSGLARIKVVEDNAFSKESETGRPVSGAARWFAVPYAKGTIVHEYGHLDEIAQSLNHLRLKQVWSMAIRAGEMSGYGKENYQEGYAEAFSDWYASNGETTNPSTLVYAEQFKWPVPNPPQPEAAQGDLPRITFAQAPPGTGRERSFGRLGRPVRQVSPLDQPIRYAPNAWEVGREEETKAFYAAADAAHEKALARIEDEKKVGGITAVHAAVLRHEKKAHDLTWKDGMRQSGPEVDKAVAQQLGTAYGMRLANYQVLNDRPKTPPSKNDSDPSHFESGFWQERIVDKVQNDSRPYTDDAAKTLPEFLSWIAKRNAVSGITIDRGAVGRFEGFPRNIPSFEPERVNNGWRVTFGLYDPVTRRVGASVGDRGPGGGMLDRFDYTNECPEAMLHELGHALDYSGTLSHQFSESEQFLSLYRSLMGGNEFSGVQLRNYPASKPWEFFAQAFAAYNLALGGDHLAWHRLFTTKSFDNAPEATEQAVAEVTALFDQLKAALASSLYSIPSEYAKMSGQGEAKNAASSSR